MALYSSKCWLRITSVHRLVHMGLTSHKPQQSYFGILRKSKAKAPSIHRGKPQVCGCFGGRVRNSSSSQIIFNFPLNHMNRSSSSLYSTNLLRTDQLSFNFLVFRQFHRKKDNFNERRMASKQPSQEKQENNKEESTFSNTFRTILFASTFTLAAFSLLDLWTKFITETDIIWSLFNDQNSMNAVSRQFLSNCFIIAINAIVYGLWWLPSLELTLTKIATTSKDSRLISMLFAAFSHRNFIHIFVNMYVLMSFSMAWERLAAQNRFRQPKEYMSPEKFLAFFMSAGVAASAGSRIFQIITSQRTLSLGASGAIFGLVGYICTKLPESQLSIVFLPQFTFSAKNALIGLMLFDTAGLIIGALTNWRYLLLDHSAHLSGALFGIWYANHGERMLHRLSIYMRNLQNDIMRKR